MKQQGKHRLRRFASRTGLPQWIKKQRKAASGKAWLPKTIKTPDNAIEHDTWVQILEGVWVCRRATSRQEPLSRNRDSEQYIAALRERLYSYIAE